MTHKLKRVRVSLVVLAGLAATADAAVIFDSGPTLFTPTGIQSGRISRDGLASEWSSVKSFPGIVNPVTPYRYEVFPVTTGSYPFIQISLDDPNGNLFISAYLNSYNPGLGLDVNYLGDPGNSQPFGNPAFFQIVAAANTLLVLPVNETTVAGGTGDIFDVLVEGFYGPDFSETPPVPEPSTLILVGIAAAAACCRKRRRHHENRTV